MGNNSCSRIARELSRQVKAPRVLRPGIGLRVGTDLLGPPPRMRLRSRRRVDSRLARNEQKSVGAHGLRVWTQRLYAWNLDYLLRNHRLLLTRANSIPLPPDQPRFFSRWIQSRTSSRSIGSVTEPWPRTAAWKARRSKRDPSSRSASARRAKNSRPPESYEVSWPGMTAIRSTRSSASFPEKRPLSLMNATTRSRLQPWTWNPGSSTIPRDGQRRRCTRAKSVL